MLKSGFLQRIRVVHTLSVIALYLLGTGMARHLGERIQGAPFWMGLLWLLSLTLGFYFLGDHLQEDFEIGILSRIPGVEDQTPEESKWEDLALYLSVALFACSAVLTIFIGFLPIFQLDTALLMALIFGGFVLLVVPGIRVGQSGLGEPLLSGLLVLLPPALGYYLQTGEYHRFLPLSVFPIYPFHLAMLLFWRLPGYAEDLRRGRMNLMTRLGWVQGVFLHNLLILIGFLLLGLAFFFGFPTRIVLLILLILPLAAYQLWYLSSLQNGAPTRWYLLGLLSGSLFFVPVYLITYSFWIS